MLAAVEVEVAHAFVQIGAIGLVLATLSLIAGRLGITSVPLYLLAGLALGRGSIGEAMAGDFATLGAEIGVLLLLLTLGLEYSGDELRSGFRTGLVPGAVDAVTNALPGVALGLVLGWSLPAAVLLGGVSWVSSSGVISKVLTDLDRLGNRETPAVLNLLVIEDLAMAVYLPVVAAVVAGEDPGKTVVAVTVALVTVAVVLWAAIALGPAWSARIEGASNESLLLGVFGATLVVGGLAQQLRISAAIGAFLVGLGVSGNAQIRARALVEPLRDLFAAMFFFVFAARIDPSALPGVLPAAALLLLVTAGTKIGTGWMAAARRGSATAGRLRAGTVLVSRGEFSIVVASLGVALTDGPELEALAAAYVLLTAVVGPLLTKAVDRSRPGRTAGSTSSNDSHGGERSLVSSATAALRTLSRRSLRG